MFSEQIFSGTLLLFQVYILFIWTVSEKLRSDPENEVSTTGLHVSLICPVSENSASFVIFIKIITSQIIYGIMYI